MPIEAIAVSLFVGFVTELVKKGVRQLSTTSPWKKAVKRTAEKYEEIQNLTVTLERWLDNQITKRELEDYCKGKKAEERINVRDLCEVLVKKGFYYGETTEEKSAQLIRDYLYFLFEEILNSPKGRAILGTMIKSSREESKQAHMITHDGIKKIQRRADGMKTDLTKIIGVIGDEKHEQYKEKTLDELKGIRELETFPSKAVLYVDILGYDKRARDEAKKTGRPVEDIRRSYIASVEERLNELKKRGIIAFHTKPDYSDAWLIFTDSVWSALEILGEILEAQLPLAVAIGTGIFEHPHRMMRSNKIIAFLKTDIISHYIRFYKKTYQRSPVETFILLTFQAYEQIDSKGICSQPYSTADFYLIKQEEFERELRISQFLKKVNLRRVEYREIEKLYVDPKNYKQLKSILDEHHIVFLVGDAEEGKTYTAMRLLLEYSKEYEPVYVPEERERKQWEFIRGRQELKGKIIYLEDPWGKVEFEWTESLFGEIGTFLAEAKGEKCRIIVTSREKVFREFEKRVETAQDLRDYVARFKIHLTYSVENLREMLEKYVNVFEPPWGKDEKLRDTAVQAVNRKLRTPMSIKKLMDYSRQADNIDKLQAAIEKAAADTKIAFAREIKEIFNRGEYDKLVFFGLVYIGVATGIASSCYKRALKDLGYDLIRASCFDDLLDEFDEVESTYSLRFIHPSYWDAFNSALTDGHRPNNICRKIFSPLLVVLSERDEAAGSVARAVRVNFDKLSEDVRNRLLLTLSVDYSVVMDVAWVVVTNFEKLSEDVRNRLLLTLSETHEGARNVAGAIVENFDKLSGDVRAWLFTLAEKDETARPVAWVVATSLWLPEDVENRVLLTLAGKNEGAPAVAWAVNRNFGKFSEDIRNRLLLTLSKKDKAARSVAWVVGENFDKIPKDVRNRLLLTLSKKDKAARPVAWVIIRNFDKLSENVRALLFTLAEKDETAEAVARTVRENFDKIPEDVRNRLLVILSERDKATKHVARIVGENFDKIPEDVRNRVNRS